MDWADRVVERPVEIRRADPLKGVDVKLEYELILEHKSNLHPRIQEMVIKRMEQGL